MTIINSTHEASPNVIRSQDVAEALCLSIDLPVVCHADVRFQIDDLWQALSLYGPEHVYVVRHGVGTL